MCLAYYICTIVCVQFFTSYLVGFTDIYIHYTIAAGIRVSLECEHSLLVTNELHTQHTQ